MFITEEIRLQAGRFSKVTARYMLAAGIERMGICGACGHEIKHHYGVKSPTGKLLWVGSQCVTILTADTAGQEIDITPGTRWQDDGREYIKPTAAWIARLHIEAYGETDEEYIERMKHASFGSGGRRIHNQFLASIAHSLDRYGQLTIRQYEAASRAS